MPQRNSTKTSRVGKGPRRAIFRNLLKLLEYASYLLALGLTVGAIGLAALFVSYSKGLPPLDPLLKYSPWNQTTQVLAADGSLIGEFFEEDRTVIGIDRIPDVMKKAVIAIEDERFDTNHPTAWIRRAGIDPIGIVRAAVVNLMAGRTVQGGSTITQQLAKNLFFTKERTLKRKIQEIILAYRIEQHFSRDEIMERYLNKVFFGNHAYGIHSAASRYFGVDLQKPGSTLTLGQAAMLAGIVKAPSDLAPHHHPELARARQKVVLARMAARGYITQAAADAAVKDFWSKFDPKKVSIPEDASGVEIKVAQAGFFLEFVRQELLKTIDAESLYKGGFKIHTTLDPKVQAAAEVAMKEGLDRLTKEVKARRISLAKGPLEGALVAVDQKTGRILAMIGGSSWSETNQFNRAVLAKRQAGSAFKPFVYFTALESGDATLGTVLRDEAFVVPGSTWSPKNYDGVEHGPVLPRTAITHSFNIAAVRMLLLATAERVLERAKAMGIDVSKMAPYPSLALGAYEVSLIEMTSAYSAFANGGTRVEPYPITSIFDRDGRPVRNFEPFQTHQVFAPDLAFLMTSLMQSVVRNGTAASTVGARIGKISAAGKTGTTDDYADAWFMGYTPAITAGVWIGFDERRTMGTGMTGGHTAGAIWAQFIRTALQGRPVSAFPPPPQNIIQIPICALSGLRVSPDCPDPISEYFIDASAPTDICTVHSDPSSLQQFLYGDRAADTGVVEWPDNFSVLSRGAASTDTSKVIDDRERLKAVIDAEAPRQLDRMMGPNYREPNHPAAATPAPSNRLNVEKPAPR